MNLGACKFGDVCRYRHVAKDDPDTEGLLLQMQKHGKQDSNKPELEPARWAPKLDQCRNCGTQFQSAGELVTHLSKECSGRIQKMAEICLKFRKGVCLSGENCRRHHEGEIKPRGREATRGRVHEGADAQSDPGEQRGEGAGCTLSLVASLAGNPHTAAQKDIYFGAVQMPTPDEFLPTTISF